ncbi:hypothetical protein ACFL6N_00665 [Thermodesulfobacteriota bacterium]
MPISIEYDRKNNVLYAKADGVISSKDFELYYSSLGTIGLQPHYRVLADFNEADVKLDSGEIMKLAAQREKKSEETGNVRIAIVAKSDLQFGLSRIYKARVLNDKVNMMIFRDKIDAIKWLNI